jgi:predicted enzyme related to lactoylglutathione lyase
MSNTFFGLAFDVADAADQATFWAQATGGKVEDGATQDDAVVSGSGFPRLAFHGVPEGKTAKNRMHIDLIASDYEAELDRLLGLGATKINEMTPGGARWTTLADPEGNEFDVIAG